MSWASRRQLKYILIIFGIFLLFIIWVIYPIIFKKATCFDGKLDGNEVGIDCGGSCSQICPSEVSSAVTVWSRAFPVTGNIYNLLAYVENPNKDAGVPSIKYEFKIYDSNNRLIGLRDGNTFIPPDKQFAVFEPRFNAGKSKIKSISFEFIPPFNWQKKEPTLNTLPINVSDINYNSNLNSSSLSALVTNNSIYNIPTFNIIAILYDANGNAINVSKTQREGLASNNKLPISFTWPKPLASTPVREDVFVQINPFTASF